MDWARKPSKKDNSAKIRAKAEPFIKWLAEADEEDESTDEDDDGLEVSPSRRLSCVGAYGVVSYFHKKFCLR